MYTVIMTLRLIQSLYNINNISLALQFRQYLEIDYHETNRTQERSKCYWIALVCG